MAQVPGFHRAELEPESLLSPSSHKEDLMAFWDAVLMTGTETATGSDIVGEGALQQWTQMEMSDMLLQRPSTMELLSLDALQCQETLADPSSVSGMSINDCIGLSDPGANIACGPARVRAHTRQRAIKSEKKDASRASRLSAMTIAFLGQNKTRRAPVLAEVHG